ncbi:histidine kinase dimerization/phosphoacceptor domain -containing protein [Larkinella terrae]|uniref:histidine kinase n=1 Tax=Larkinella terrae TaxID=2025311 RepID=A0A7K0EPE7_9BACT|nr:histidine kinase dimerization/phosphoacceptor domain -containing protein [Larkinella terrae]MRS63664.1 tetratricopeptide repeat protein [Larkinella terrae]
MKWFLSLGAIILFLQQAYAQSTSVNFDSLKATLVLKPDTIQISEYQKFAETMLHKGQAGDAQMALNTALSIAKNLKNGRYISKVYQSLGQLEIDQGNFVQALGRFQEALDYLRSSPVLYQKIEILLRIGQTYFSVNDLKQAELYYREALQLARQYNRPVSMADAYSELANLEDTRKNSRQALIYNEKAIAIYKANGEEYIGTLFNRAIEFKNAGKYAQSERIYRQCLEYAEEHKDEYLKGYVYVNLPNTLLLLNRTDEAEKYAQLALKWSETGPERLKIREEVFDILTRIYEKKGQDHQALAYFRQKTMYRDSVLNAEKARQLIMAENRYQAREKESQIRKLDEENSRKAQQLGWLSGGLAVLIGLLGLSFWQYRTIRRTNARLMENNRVISESHQKISDQSQQLKTLLRELNHRVKNNLAIVSSLLRLQSKRLEDEGAVQAVRAGQQRVEAMALIHQRLYMTDNVSTINIKEYITDLFDGLLIAYGYDKTAFDREIDIEHEELDVDLSVILGLILNEILTNAFKYAYEHVPRPFLRISLSADDSDHPNQIRPQLTLEVQDNGAGMDPGRWERPTGSFGKRLITSLSEQAGGQLEVSNRNGTYYRLIIPPLNSSGSVAA